MQSTIPRKLLARYRSLRRALDQAAFHRLLSRRAKKMRSPRLAPRSKRVVFNTVRPFPESPHLLCDLYMGHLLARAGHYAHILLDDGALNHWDTAQVQNCRMAHLNPMRDSKTAINFRNAVTSYTRIFAHPRLAVQWYGDLLRGRPLVGFHAQDAEDARTSTLRYFETGTQDLSDTSQAAYYELSKHNAQVSRSIGKHIVEILQPDMFVTSHGFYSSWGPALRAVRERDISTRIYSVHPYRLGGIIIGDSYGGTINMDDFDAFINTHAMTEQEFSISEEYFATRLSHQASDTREYFQNLTNEENYTLAFDTPPKHILGLFPNVPWDAVGEHLAPIYPNVIDWIVDTARTVAGLPDVGLLIRLHPGEATRLRDSIQTLDTLRAIAPDVFSLPNVKVIAPDDPVDTYELLQRQVDVALVYSGTLGAEAQLCGVPVVSVAKGRFSQHFTTQPRSRDDYRNLLGNLAQVRDGFIRERDNIHTAVLKYHYYVNELLFYPIPILSSRSRNIVTTAELRSRDFNLSNADASRLLTAITSD